jgi:hypothetical protein
VARARLDDEVLLGLASDVDRVNVAVAEFLEITRRASPE